jgi:hypothetical protein
MRSAIGKWIGAVVIAEVDPDEFDGPGCDELLTKLNQHFMQEVAMITPDWEADFGIRARGLPCPIEILASADLVWRDLVLPVEEEELPF